MSGRAIPSTADNRAATKAVVQERRGILRRWSAPETFEDSESSPALRAFYEYLDAGNPELARKLRRDSRLEFRRNWIIWGSAKGGRRVRFIDA